MALGMEDVLPSEALPAFDTLALVEADTLALDADRDAGIADDEAEVVLPCPLLDADGMVVEADPLALKDGLLCEALPAFDSLALGTTDDDALALGMADEEPLVLGIDDELPSEALPALDALALGMEGDDALALATDDALPCDALPACDALALAPGVEDELPSEELPVLDAEPDVGTADAEADVMLPCALLDTDGMVREAEPLSLEDGLP